MARGALSRIGMLSRREMIDDEDLLGTVETGNPGPDGLGGPREMNITTESLKGNVTTKQSQTGKVNQLPGPTRKVAVDGQGSVTVEVAPGPQCDEHIEEGLCEVFSTPLAIDSTTISFDAGANQILSTGGALADVRLGSWISVFDSTSNLNDGRMYVTGKPDDDTVVVSYFTITTQAAGPTIKIRGKNVRNGTKLISRSWERWHADLAEYQLYVGQVCASLQMTCTFEEIITMAIGLQGHGPAARSATSAWDGLTTVAAESIVDTVSDVSNNMRMFREGGTLSGNIKMFDWTHNNNVEAIKLGQTRNPAGQSLGTKGLTGNLNGYLIGSDGRPVKAFDHTATDFHLEIVPDGASAPVYVITIFRAKFTDMGDTPKSALSGPVPLDLPWTAEEAPAGDPGAGYWIQVCSLPKTA